MCETISKVFSTKFFDKFSLQVRNISQSENKSFKISGCASFLCSVFTYLTGFDTIKVGNCVSPFCNSPIESLKDFANSFAGGLSNKFLIICWQVAGLPFGSIIETKSGIPLRGNIPICSAVP